MGGAPNNAIESSKVRFEEVDWAFGDWGKEHHTLIIAFISMEPEGLFHEPID